MSFSALAAACRAGSRRLLLLASVPVFLFLLAQLSGSAQSPSPATDDDFTVRGIVVNSVTHAAVPRTLVYTGDNRMAKFTDGEGRFEFKIPQPQPPSARPQPGASFQSVVGSGPQAIVTMGMTFSARRPGYLDANNMQVTLQSGQGDPPELRISLVPEALITGRVHLPNPDGTDKIVVAIYERRVQQGRGRWMPAGTDITRANGDFRFANLDAGDYKLFTQELLDQDPLTFVPGRAQQFGYPPVYFPSSNDFESAAVIHLDAGQNFSANLTPARREYFPVKLHLLNASVGAGVNVSVEPQSRRGPGYSLGFNLNEGLIEGSLPNGAYTVEVTGFGETGSSGSVNISVNGAPVQGATVALSPNNLVDVRIRDDRSKPDITHAPGANNLLNALQFSFVATDEFAQFNQQLMSRPSPNGEPDSAQLFNVQPGTYRLHTGCGQAEYISSVTSGGRDLFQQPLVIGSGAAVPPIDVILRDDGAELRGQVDGWSPQMSQHRASSFTFSSFGRETTFGAAVILFSAAEESVTFCQSWISEKGEFHFTQIPPGEYRVLAFAQFPQNFEYESHEAVEKYESSAQLVRLSAADKQQIHLPLIPERE